MSFHFDRIPRWSEERGGVVMRQGPKKTCVRASRGEGRVTRPDINKTLCPSGLRGWTQVPLAQAAWVQIPQVSISRTLVSAGGGLGGWNGRRGSDELVLVSSYIPLLAYSLSSFLPVVRPSTTSRMGRVSSTECMWSRSWNG